MEPILFYPDPPTPELHKALDSSGFAWTAVADDVTARDSEPADGWSGAVVSGVDSIDQAFAFARFLRERDTPVSPILLVITVAQLDRLEERRELIDDFTLDSVVADELQERLGLLFARLGRGKRANVIVYGPLALNLDTYQAVVAGRPLDLTYMEYELLRFLAGHPGKVFTREVLLSRVWGYEYFGGARTVDVHVRRLRAKLGEENAYLIETVRSVGYRFGTTRWAP